MNEKKNISNENGVPHEERESCSLGGAHSTRRADAGLLAACAAARRSRGGAARPEQAPARGAVGALREGRALEASAAEINSTLRSSRRGARLHGGDGGLGCVRRSVFGRHRRCRHRRRVVHALRAHDLRRGDRAFERIRRRSRGERGRARRRRAALGAAAEGERHNTIFAQRRRSRRAALLCLRVPRVSRNARARCQDDAPACARRRLRGDCGAAVVSARRRRARAARRAALGARAGRSTARRACSARRVGPPLPDPTRSRRSSPRAGCGCARRLRTPTRRCP